MPAIACLAQTDDATERVRSRQSLRSAFQRDDGQLPSASVVIDTHLEPITWPAGNERPWLSTRRNTWPSSARFDSWFSIRGAHATIGLVGCLPCQTRVRSVLVVPVQDRGELASEQIVSKRNHRQQPKRLFRGENQAFDKGDASVLSYSTIPWRLDAFTFDPTSKSVAVEDAVTVANDVLWYGADASDCSPQEGA